MNRLFSFFRSFCLILVAFVASFGTVRNTELSNVGYQSLLGNELTSINRSPSRRSLLSHSNEVYDTALVATLDGSINLLDLKSAKPLWSFASGPPIYSSYQALIDHEESDAANEPGYYIDCGDDWKLYAQIGVDKINLDMTAEEYLRTTPQISEEGIVLLGSKKTTVFLIDAKSGKLIHTYSLFKSPDTPWRNKESSFSDKSSIGEWEGNANPNSMSLKNVEKPLYITRTDYLLESFALNSGKVLWNVSVSELGAAFLRQDIEKSLSSGLPHGPSDPLDMAFSQFKAKIIQLRSNIIMSHMLPGARDENLIRPTISSNNMIGLQESDDESHILLVQDSETYNVENLELPRKIGFRLFSVVYHKGVLFIFLLIVLGLLVYGFALVQAKTIKQPINLDTKVKKKKNRKSRNLENGYSNNELNFNQLVDNNVSGHRVVGKLFVSNEEIAKGSNGTIVLEGIYEGRPVAVKRLVRAHHDVAFKEIQNLIASDRHPNIVRWYGVEYDEHFVYLSLERCACSLADLVQMYSDSCNKLGFTEGQASKAMIEYKVRLDSMKDIMQNVELWKSNGYPSPILLKLMRDLVSGLVHLHELGIIHRDLKPQNVLIIKERTFCAKLSDMGISKRLVGDMSSLGHHATGHGSSGWQAPEQLLHGRQTRAVDIFSLGCVLFYCITGGRHPFGDHLERDINITKNQVDLFLVENIPEAVDLFSRLLNPLSQLRPKAAEVLQHPLFWRSEIRLSFLRDTSDRVELEDREIGSDLLIALERAAPDALNGKWDEKMEPSFLNNIGRYRRYKFDSVRDLLRVIRNKLNHYRELPPEIQEILGSVPEGFDEYFGSRFPKFLIEVYKVMHTHCKEEEWFKKYIESDV